MKTFKEHLSEQWNIVNVLMSAQQGEAEITLDNGGHITIDEASATRIIMYLQTLQILRRRYGFYKRYLGFFDVWMFCLFFIYLFF